MLTTTTARIIFIGGLSAAMASSVQLVEDGFLPKIMAGNGGRIGDPPGLGFLGPPPSGPDNCGCVLGEGMFCGTDGQCHLYNCEEYYKYGPVEYTGYGPDAPGLECRDTAEMEARPGHSPSWSVSYRCIDLDPRPIIKGWTRYCEASTPHSNFTCYGLAKDTSFQSFLAEADASNLECNSGVYNETGYPQYTYTVSLAERTDRHTESYSVVGFNGTETFDRNKALGGTMSSMFTVSPTPSPTKYLTASPVEPTPPSSSSIGKDCFFLGSTFAFVTSVIFGLI